MITSVPDHKGPRATSDYQPLCLEPEQIGAILAALPERVHKGRRAGDPIRAYYTLLWETGLRPATLARLQAADYVRPRGVLVIRSSADKARYGREVPLSEAARAALDAVCSETGSIFGRRDYRDSLKRAAARAGLPPEISRRVSPYTFRHSRISQLAWVTNDLRGVAYLAGHRDLTTTSRYVHGNVDAGRRVLEAVASAAAEFGRQPPEKGQNQVKTGLIWPTGLENSQGVSDAVAASGSCGRKPVGVRVPHFALGSWLTSSIPRSTLGVPNLSRILVTPGAGSRRPPLAASR
jgi:hypothetical protein